MLPPEDRRGRPATRAHRGNVVRSLVVLLVAVAMSGCSAKDPSATPEAPATQGTIVPSQTAALLTAAGQTVQLSARAIDASGAETAVTWRSSDPGQVRVDANGTVTAVAAIGSALVFAESVDASAPIPVIIAEPVPGALLVTDAQVASQPAFLAAPDGYPANGTRMRVTVSGIAPPAAGTIVLGTGSTPLAGRVVSSTVAGDGASIEYELVALPEMLARYSIDIAVPLGGPEGEATAVGGGKLLAGAGELDGAIMRRLADGKAKAETKWSAGPLQCSASGAATFKSTNFQITSKVDLTLKVATEKVNPDASNPHLTRVVLTGPVALDVIGGLKAEAGFEGKAECTISKHIPIPIGGIVATVLAVTVPIGLSAGAEGKIKAVDVELGPKGHLGTNVTVGFECDDTVCFAIQEQQPDDSNGITFETKVALLSDMRVEAGLSLNVMTGLGGRFGGDFGLIDAKIGPTQSLNLAFDAAQARDPGYASNYDLKIVGSVTPADDLRTAVSRLFGDAVKMDLAIKWTPEEPLATSPRGTLAAEKARVQVDKPVRLSVDIDPATADYWLIKPNLDQVVIARRLKDGSLTYLQTLSASASGQTRFDWVWTPGREFVGQNELVAFVVTNGLPGIPLEVTADSTTHVEVVDACLNEQPGGSGEPGGPAASGAPQPGTPTIPPDVCGADVTITYRSTSQLHSEEWTILGSLQRMTDATVLAPDQPEDEFVGTATYAGRGVDALSMAFMQDHCTIPQIWRSGSGQAYLTAFLEPSGWPGVDFSGPALVLGVSQAGEIPTDQESPPYGDLFGIPAPAAGGSSTYTLVRMAESECGDRWEVTITIIVAADYSNR